MSTPFRNPIVAEAYAEHRNYVDHHFMDVLSTFAAQTEGPVVDIGAGTGGPAWALVQDGHNVLAVEPSPAMISQGNKLYPELRYIRAEGEHLPLPDNFAGTTIIMYVLHHAADPVKLLSEARRITREDGQVIVVTGDPTSERQRLMQSYFPTLAVDLPSTDEVWWWGCDAGLQVGGAETHNHWVYPHRILDNDYLAILECDLFASLKSLDPEEFELGLRAMRADLGRVLPAPKATVIRLMPADLPEFEVDPNDEHPFEIQTRVWSEVLIG